MATSADAAANAWEETLANVSVLVVLKLHSFECLFLLWGYISWVSAEHSQIVDKSLFTLKSIEERDKKLTDEPDCTHESAKKSKCTNDAPVEVDSLSDSIWGQLDVESLVLVNLAETTCI